MRLEGQKIASRGAGRFLPLLLSLCLLSLPIGASSSLVSWVDVGNETKSPAGNLTASPSPAPSASTNATLAPTMAPTPNNSTDTSPAPTSAPTPNNGTETSPAPTSAPTPSNSTISPSPTLAPTPGNSTISPAPSPAPSAAPSKKYIPPPDDQPTAAPSTAPAPTPAKKHHKKKTSIGRIIAKTIAWLILIALSVLLFGAAMSNRYRIYYYMRSAWYSFLHWEGTQWVIRKLHLQRFFGGNNQDGSLNEIIFDSSDLNEGLLMNET